MGDVDRRRFGLAHCCETSGTAGVANLTIGRSRCTGDLHTYSAGRQRRRQPDSHHLFWDLRGRTDEHAGDALAEAGLRFAYGLYAAFARVSLLFVVFAVRETKGMEREDMPG
ncbi:sugar porter family MFS transporter [Frateuria terrea]|uniref:sugar porter family MFS transporter n=1 Tax=Frateuria terrea TaxID=529704 RepID=UPI001113AECD|nr:sugar porter family MFS transporter [Frateuria terrea]